MNKQEEYDIVKEIINHPGWEGLAATKKDVVKNKFEGFFGQKKSGSSARNVPAAIIKMRALVNAEETSVDKIKDLEKIKMMAGLALEKTDKNRKDITSRFYVLLVGKTNAGSSPQQAMDPLEKTDFQAEYATVLSVLEAQHSHQYDRDIQTIKNKNL